MPSSNADDRSTSPTLPPSDEARPDGHTTDVVAAPLGQRTAAYEGGATVAPAGEISDPATAPLPVFPGYEILGVLGRGGMGVVYKARNLALKRLVALKVILAGEHAGDLQRARFKAEAEAVARLQHPGIVQIYEVGAHDGKPFIALEFCPGGSLDAHLDGTPLPPADAAQLVEKLARAIHAAHQAQVVHRDLKPANVLLVSGGVVKPAPGLLLTTHHSPITTYEPKITDFGLAKKLDDASQTQSGAIVGTPSYMAPEQAGGQGKELGPPADIYALGAILYELLTGRPPFKAATPLDTIMQVVADEPVPPTQLQSRTPKDLETICLKCLRKEPAKRYATAADLADELARYVRGEPILARPVGHAERLWRWCGRNRARDAGFRQAPGHAQPDLPQALQQGRLVEVVAHELVKQKALYPVHFQDGIELAVNANAFRQIGEIDCEGKLGLDEAFADLEVTLLQVGDLTGEALEGPFLAAGPVKFVNVGEVARARHGHAEGIGDGLAAAQLTIAEGARRVLDRLVVIL